MVEAYVADHLFDRADRLSVDGDDHVARLQSGFGGRAVARNGGDRDVVISADPEPRDHGVVLDHQDGGGGREKLGNETPGGGGACGFTVQAHARDQGQYRDSGDDTHDSGHHRGTPARVVQRERTGTERACDGPHRGRRTNRAELGRMTPGPVGWRQRDREARGFLTPLLRLHAPQITDARPPLIRGSTRGQFQSR